MSRTAVWKSIAETLRGEIAEGHYRPGDKLPTEAAFSARFGVNRHTVRRALADLVERGHVHTRRGAGSFVATATTEYPLGRRVRFSQNLLAAGRTPTRKILLLETRAANAREAEALRIEPGRMVHVYEGVSYADDTPIALASSAFPADRLPGLRERIEETTSVTRALACEGIDDYTRAWTRITAKLASATQALHLAIREGDPILRSVSLNVGPDSTPVEFGRTWFAGDRVTLSLSGENE
ncbi:phosphonate metabolism transcriptional regulator PhnF [Tropicimonas marinistellae]|uniref:phosphonate metabolism transcriptional regulator PhnF n=1 Tax=Tropicimonas marinistellae TaxID=1739787 RepID=UPI00082D3ED5|nr:phosphonate metabolism transcriptional regulator PhnF [Tropicimonas marinistellae]